MIGINIVGIVLEVGTTVRHDTHCIGHHNAIALTAELDGQLVGGVEVITAQIIPGTAILCLIRSDRRRRSEYAIDRGIRCHGIRGIGRIARLRCPAGVDPEGLRRGRRDGVGDVVGGVVGGGLSCRSSGMTAVVRAVEAFQGRGGGPSARDCGFVGGGRVSVVCRTLLSVWSEGEDRGVSQIHRLLDHIPRINVLP